MRKRLYLISIVLITLFLSTSCDDFYLLEQFGMSLELIPQKTTVQQGETIQLYPKGGESPYSISPPVAENLYYEDSLGSIGGYSYTAGDSIGEIRIVITDSGGLSADAIITIIPPRPQNLTIDDSVSKEITLSWDTYDASGVDGLRIMRAEVGENLK